MHVRSVCKLMQIGPHLGHGGHALVCLWQAVQEAARGVQQRRRRLHIVPAEVVQQQLRSNLDSNVV